MRLMGSCLFGVAVCGVICGGLAAQDDRPDLSGTWLLDATKSDMQLVRLNGLTLVISEKDGKININEDEKLADGKELKMTYSCPTDGQDCKVPETGAKASFWYNGPMLVKMETEKKGTSVVRQRLKLSPDTKTLTVEISQIVPQTDKIDKLIFAKQ